MDTEHEDLLTRLEECQNKALAAYCFAQKLEDDHIIEKLETIIADLAGLKQRAREQTKEAST